MLRLPACSIAKEAAFRRNFALNAKLKNKSSETYYDVLNVRSDCSKRDLRNAYLKLSKQYHPDVKSTGVSVDGTARFVKITEAYQTLVKTSTRKEYDDSLIWNSGGMRETIQPWEVRPNDDPNPGPYYGIKGLNRLSNWEVAFFLISLCVIGAFFGFSSVKHSFELNRRIQDEISAEANAHHAAVVADAQKYGNQEQMRRMLDRLAKDRLAQAAAK